MRNLFVVSDIHGHIEQFEELLAYWNREDTLIILGDLIDRGPQSLRVIEKVMTLKAQYKEQVMFLKGNHEDMLLKFLQSPEEKQAHYSRNGGKETMESFFERLGTNMYAHSVKEQAQIVVQQFEQQLTFLQQAPVVQIVGGVLFTHAGFNSQKTLDETTDQEFIWIRKHYEVKNETPYVNVFGHTPLPYIHQSTEVWQSDDKRYIAIDGGCYMSGRLNAVLLTEAGQLLQTFFVEHPMSDLILLQQAMQQNQ